MTQEEIMDLINRGVLSIDVLNSAIALAELELNKKKEAERLASRFPYRTIIYCHRDKESNWDQFKEAGFSEEEIQKWDLAYVGYEIGVEIQINADGTVEYLGLESV